MTTRYRVTDVHNYGDQGITLYRTEVPDYIGELALAMLHKWGPVNGKADGEDSQGRAKMREMTPEETVTRALDIAEEFYRQVRQRGLLVALPDLNEVNAARDKRKAEKLKKDPNAYVE